ncbi:acyl-CoA dehydrogenase family protein [Flavisphingomonas formosensis]|uniref:acyl-CoA dehydrogenase family protein n=1 Tax=Flavisphingomonas formosensis TaxID=861534 RepID=UPI0012FAF6BA|nr:acyl-CoA dehydrogenase family protein [Sphingomonas formosensis]
MADDILSLGDLRDAIRQVLRGHAGPLDAIPEETGAPFDHALWATMAELGWLGLGIDEAQGGLGLSIAHLAVLFEELGGVLGAVPAIETLIAANAIAAHGAETARAQLLPAIVAGETVATIALPAAAIPDIANGAVTGTIEHVAFAGDAGLFLLPVRNGAETVLALIASDAPGVSAEARPVSDLTRALGWVRLRDVAVRERDLLRPGAEGWDAIADQLAIAIACDAIGGAAEILARTVDYLGIRVQFGRPIGSFQALKHRAASWKVLLEAASALVRHAAVALAAGEEGAAALVSSAKFYACDVYAAICEDAVQLHGGIGFTWEHPCHLFLKRAKLDQLLYGSATTHKERVARLAFAAIAAEAEGGIPPFPEPMQG